MFLVEEQFWNLMEILGGIKMIVENKCLGTQMKTSGVDFNGKHYKSNASLAKAFNIPLQTFLSRRYALHWSLEQCVRHDIKSRRAPFKILGREFSVFQCRDESPSLSSLKSYHNIYKVSIIYTKIHDSKTKDHDISIMIYLIYRMGTIQIYACGVHSL